MKKVICYSLLVIGCLLATAQADVTRAMITNTVTQADVLALLPQADNLQQTNSVLMRSYYVLPTAERVAYGEIVKTQLSNAQHIAGINVDLAASEAQRNGFILQYYDAGGTAPGPMQRFKPGPASEEACVYLYRLAAKNLPTTAANQTLKSQSASELAALLINRSDLGSMSLPDLKAVVDAQ